MQCQGGNSSILSAKSQTNENPYLGNFTWKIGEMQIGVVNQSQVNHQFKKIMFKYVPAALSITAVGPTYQIFTYKSIKFYWPRRDQRIRIQKQLMQNLVLLLLPI